MVRGIEGTHGQAIPQRGSCGELGESRPSQPHQSRVPIRVECRSGLGRVLPLSQRQVRRAVHVGCEDRGLRRYGRCHPLVSAWSAAEPCVESISYAVPPSSKRTGTECMRSLPCETVSPDPSHSVSHSQLREWRCCRTISTPRGPRTPTWKGCLSACARLRNASTCCPAMRQNV